MFKQTFRFSNFILYFYYEIYLFKFDEFNVNFVLFYEFDSTLDYYTLA